MNGPSPRFAFSPEQPGVICIAADRHGHYTPSPENALRFLQGGDTEGGIRRFLDDNVKAVRHCAYVPDVSLLVFRLRALKDVPLPEEGQRADSYIRGTLFPHLASEDRLPDKEIALKDAVYSSRTKGTPDCTALNRPLMQDPGYEGFLSEQRERKDTYRDGPEYLLPLTVVENHHGYLLFSGNETGRKGFKACIQHIADHYFDPHYDMRHLYIYECPAQADGLAPYIDTAYAPHRYLPVSGFDFSPQRYVDAWRLPKEFLAGLKPVFQHPLKPDFEGFQGFISRFREDERTKVTVSRPNHDICRLLAIIRHGYMNVHEKPFTYFDALLPMARKLERITQVKSPGQFNAEDFRIHSLALRLQAETILRRDFDVRGHRSLVHELDDPNLAFQVGHAKLSAVQRAVLADGHALCLPENDRPGSRQQLYCRADFPGNRLEGSPSPFPGVQTYRMTHDGLLQRMDAGKTREAVKKETGNGRNAKRPKM